MRAVGIGAIIGAAALWLVSQSGAIAEDWQKEWADVQAKAKGQELNLVVHSYEAHEAVAREFQRRFPDIKVNVTPATPSSTAPRIVTEQKNGIYAWDSWWASTGNMTSVVLPVGGFDPISDYFILPEVKDLSNWRRPDLLYSSDKRPYIVVHSYYQEGTGFWNTNVVKGFKLDNFDTLLDPRLKGMITIEEPKRANAGAFATAFLLKEKGEAFARKFLVDQDPTFLSITRQVTDSVVRSEKVVALGGNPETVGRCWKSGGCKNVQRIPNLVYLLGRGVGVLKNAPHKEATKVWINWLLSKEGQEVYVQTWAKTNDSGAVSMRKDVEPDPHHLDSVPDYANLDKLISVATDRGQADVDAAIKLYTQISEQR